MRIRDTYEDNVVFRFDPRTGNVDDLGPSEVAVAIGSVPYFMNSPNGKTMFYDGSNDFFTYVNNFNLRTNDATFTGWFKCDNPTTSQYLYGKTHTGKNVDGRYYFRIEAGAFIAGIDVGSVVETTANTTILPGVLYHYTVTFDRDGNCSVYINGLLDCTPGDISAGDGVDYNTTYTFIVGGAGPTPTLYYGGQLGEIVMYNVALSPQEVSTNYTESLNEAHFDKTYINIIKSSDGQIKESVVYLGQGWNATTANVSSGYISNTGCIANTGAWSVRKSGDTKKIHSTTSGIFYAPQRIAYGTIRFTINKNGAVFLYFINDVINGTNTTGYHIYSPSDGSINFAEDTTGTPAWLFGTAAGTIPLFEDFILEIERNEAGEFSFYEVVNEIRTLIPATSGSNPVIDNTNTTSKYMVFDIDTGDSIKDIVIKGL